MSKALLQAALPAAGLAAAIACTVLGANRYSPFLYEFRDALLPTLIAAGLALAIAFRPRRGRPEGEPPSPPWLRSLRLVTFLAALASLGVTTAAEARFRQIRAEVLAAPPELLERLGRHIMVGADEPAELRKLIELRAVSGVFISWRQAKGRNVAKLAASMHELQELQRAAGGAPLWIAADQEGGQVQRLSPPLKRLSSLSAVVGKHPYKAEREVAVRAFAREQGRALASVGVNVNFAPVVDINHSGKRYRDGRTRLFGRKISDDPETVAETARWYCEGLYAEGVRCTRKHFPGLGNVFADTHVREAMLTTPLDTLVKSDWVPFQSMSRPDWVMVGHMRAEAIDPDHPASASRGVIDKLRGLGHNGIVVTDDFSMGAIQRSKLGAGGAAVAALNAGVDVILVSYDTHQIYKVLHALVLAHLNGRLDMAMLEASDRRLAEARAHRPGYVAEVPVVQSALIPAVAMSPPAPEPEMPAGPAAGEPDPAPSRSAAVITAIPAPLPAVAPAQGATTGVPPAMGGQNGAEATQGLEPRKIRPARGSKARVAQVRFVAKRQVAAPQRRPFKLRAKR